MKERFHIGRGIKTSCAYCGARFYKPTYNTKTCSEDCREDYAKEMHRKRYQKRKKLIKKQNAKKM